MLRVTNSPDSQVTAEHRGKLAYIYVRQSSVNQVRHHQESTELQYRLIDRAVALGWPHERVHVIDEDLGKSGSGSVEREGFKKLSRRSDWATRGSSSASMPRGSPATIVIGINSLICAHCSALLLLTANESTTLALTTIVSCSVCPAS